MGAKKKKELEKLGKKAEKEEHGRKMKEMPNLNKAPKKYEPQGRTTTRPKKPSGAVPMMGPAAMGGVNFMDELKQAQTTKDMHFHRGRKKKEKKSNPPKESSSSKKESSSSKKESSSSKKESSSPKTESSKENVEKEKDEEESKEKVEKNKSDFPKKKVPNTSNNDKLVGKLNKNIAVVKVMSEKYILQLAHCRSIYTS